MARTKGDTVRLALAKIGVTSFGYEVPPDQLRDGLIVLESMMAAWDANGVKVGYKLADTPEQAQAESDSGLPDIAYRAVDTNLACDLADFFGKQISPLLLSAASSSYSQLLAAVAYIPEMSYGRRMPRGSGNTFRWTRWSRFYRETSSLDADNAGEFTTTGDGPINIQ